MPVDPVDPVPPPIPPHTMHEGTNSSTTGLPSNVAAALASIPLVGGVIFFVLEKRDSFVRFYAMQSIIFGGAWIIFSIVWHVVAAIFGSIPGLRFILLLLWGLVWALVSIAFLVIFIICVVKAFSGVRWEIPYLGHIARKHADGTSVP
ncbi:MAG: hypothetical protein M3Y86_12110 [Verrucomicrobiota bacterium]|nr:hypothetical protein [Verrucomicrobiota bacterium]